MSEPWSVDEVRALVLNSTSPFLSESEFDAWLNTVRAAAWDEGHADGQTNEHEHRPGRKITNPYRTGGSHE